MLMPLHYHHEASWAVLSLLVYGGPPNMRNSTLLFVNKYYLLLFVLLCFIIHAKYKTYIVISLRDTQKYYLSPLQKIAIPRTIITIMHSEGFALKSSLSLSATAILKVTFVHILHYNYSQNKILITIVINSSLLLQR